MNDNRIFVLDANAFIHRHYAFDICPGYRSAILRGFVEGRLISIQLVRDELLRGNDDLRAWAADAAPPGLFQSIEDFDTQSLFAEVAEWAQSNSQYKQSAKQAFLAGADGWLIACARRTDGIIVTEEESAPLSLASIKLPDAAANYGVGCVKPDEMLRRLGYRFVLED